MLAEAFASVKRRYLGDGAPARPRAGGDDDTESGPIARGDRPSLRLTPNEEILRLIGERDGRIEQGEIVDTLACSPATVSRRLSQLESEGAVVRYPVGRRKIVCLPGCEPAAARSPFEA